MEERTRTAFGGVDRGGSSQGLFKKRVNEAVERGGIIEKGCWKEKIDGLEVVREMATDMVCIRLVNLKVWLHFWPLMNHKSIACTSALISLSMAFFFSA